MEDFQCVAGRELFSTFQFTVFCLTCTRPSCLVTVRRHSPATDRVTYARRWSEDASLKLNEPYRGWLPHSTISFQHHSPGVYLVAFGIIHDTLFFAACGFTFFFAFCEFHLVLVNGLCGLSLAILLLNTRDKGILLCH